MKHWIAVISRAHARIAADSGFLQVCHGKAGPLRRTSAGDEVFIYCPRSEMGGGDVLKTVEFHCVFNNDDVYQVEQFPGFTPHRKDVVFNRHARPVVLKEVEGLVFTADSHWGMLARRGFFEIGPHDAYLLREAMREAE
ncbi:TPA: EVE domain-containing protein [Salmonella enterica]|uniref:EVE domain-containing protein n=1 Tax=Salmonella enterica TaxID=28901 RepID=A0A754B7S9_SALER|nr:EVE domain-containing protein [Salmonella enterica]ECU9164114.1 EVE domain-containing protein [Salmonella enterica subsp. enterica serovar Newport str. CFSAN000599]EDU1196814.1 EVE domain-containing protein [Salmonella enterica subsp. enterica serovar Heidelberg str. CFSAN000576]HAF8580917.1 EVE domain-containing protein [Salmonella enterica]